MNDTSSRDDLKEVAGYYVTGGCMPGGKRGVVIACLPAGPAYPLSLSKLASSFCGSAGDSGYILVPDTGDCEAALFTREGEKIQLSYTPGAGKIEELAKTLEYLLVGFGFSTFDSGICEPDIIILTLSPRNEKEFFKTYAAARGFAGEKTIGIVIHDSRYGGNSDKFSSSFTEYISGSLGASTRLLGWLGNRGSEDPAVAYSGIAAGIIDLAGSAGAGSAGRGNAGRITPVRGKRNN